MLANTDCRQIAAAEHESNMWQHHSNQLLRIITLRRQSQNTEPYHFIVSCLSGTGDFVQEIKI
jgi:hypothetical protein